jgi:uncharacterized protein (DUF305 family)
MKTKIISSLRSSVKKLQISSLMVGIFVGALLVYATSCIFWYGVRGMKPETASSHMMSDYSDEKYKMNATNPFMMRKVTGEKQYLQDMVLHHDAAVLMSQQVLLLKDIRPEVSDLAKNIIEAQSMEIKMMKDWMTAWGY